MRRTPSDSGRNQEQGIIITLVAIFMLFVVGAMAALSIDVVTFYTARSEAQVAADSAALAAARVLANSGMTSSTGTTTNTFPVAATETLAATIATQVAQQNPVGGSTLAASQISVSFSNDSSPVLNNPLVTVKVTRTNLPTFFARIWGTTAVTVSASATAEAYNPSGLASAVPVAPACVKPWLLPNMDPSLTSANGEIFDPSSGAIQAPGLFPTGLLGWESQSPPEDLTSLHVACTGGDCSGGFPTTLYSWQYLPADPGTFSPPSPTRSRALLVAPSRRTKSASPGACKRPLPVMRVFPLTLIRMLLAIPKQPRL